MLTIGKVARAAGLRPSAIRFYELNGILRHPKRLPNGYRFYGEDTVAILRFIGRAEKLGIKLSDIKGLLELARDGRQPCCQVKDLARRYVQEIDIKLRELKGLRAELQALQRKRTSTKGSEVICPLIERSASQPSSFNSNSPKRPTKRLRSPLN